MADNKLEYGTASQAITCTLASLAQAGARECTAIDNSTNKFFDAMVELQVKLQTGTPAADQAVYVYFYGSQDGTDYTDNATGSDAAVTLRDPTNLLGPWVIATPASGALTYKTVIPSVASFFGGILPVEWGFVVENQTNITFDATEGNHIKVYRGIYSTST